MFVFVAAALLFASCVNDEEYNGVVDTSMTVLPGMVIPFSSDTPLFSSSLVDFLGESVVQSIEQSLLKLGTGTEFTKNMPLDGITQGLADIKDTGVSFKNVIIKAHAFNSFPFTFSVEPNIPEGNIEIDKSFKQGSIEEPKRTDFTLVVASNDVLRYLDDITLKVYGNIEGDVVEKYVLKRESSLKLYFDTITFVSGIDLDFN